MLGGLGSWSIGTEIAGAVVASGTLEVESEHQVIQHADGGVVGEIFARDGDSVVAGETLLRLDGTFLKSELAIVESRLAETFARSARLEAERDEAEKPNFESPPDFAMIDDETVANLVRGQENLFDVRRTSLEQERSQLAQQQAQIERQIEGMQSELTALSRQRDLVSEEVENVQSLLERGLIESRRLSELLRDDAQLLGEIGNLNAMVAEAETRISALAIERLRLADRRREDAITPLRDLGARQFEFEERRLTLEEQIARLDVKAPVSGTVFASTVAARQSVVQAAEPMMYIVPSDQPLQVSARIDPVDVDQVFQGQNVSLMFTTFNRRTTPEVAGSVLRVSADAETDEATGTTYYQAVIAPDETTLAAMPEMSLLPGMPVEAFLKTENRTPLSYLTQPLTVYFQRAFREE